MKIPTITDDDINDLLAHIKPMVYDEAGIVPCTFDPVHPRNVSFIWGPDGLRPVEGIEPWRQVRTLHTYGHPALFKPSIAEVLAQLTGDLSEVVGFTIRGPADADELNVEREALNAGFHVGVVTLWRCA
jgi:hypothetical protein